MRQLLVLALAAFLPAIASAQIVNGDFETGDLTGWTLGVTSGGANALQQVIAFDIDGPGPLGTTLSAQFSAGRATGVTTGEHGVTLMQTVTLSATLQYTFEFDWAASRTAGAGANTQGGIFALMVGTTEIARGAAGSTSGATPRFGHVSGVFTPGADGDYSVGVWILRPFTIPTPATPTLFQNIDNFTMSTPAAVPEPATIAFFGAALSAVLVRKCFSKSSGRKARRQAKKAGPPATPSI